MTAILAILASLYRFRGYEPQPVTVTRLLAWLTQFTTKDWKALAALLMHVRFFSRSQVRKLLVDRNRALMTHLKSMGYNPNQIIYVSIDDAGSSSPVMLNMLRDAARLQKLGCLFLDSQNTRGLHDATNQLSEGVIVYVDDFVGTATQFAETHNFASSHIVGNFTEYMLAPVICEEGIHKLGELGIQPIAGHVHSKSERPLHVLSTLLPDQTKQHLISICETVHSRTPLGFGDIASMIIFFSNAPDNVPAVLRGSTDQTPYKGIFPRVTDLAARQRT